MSKHIRHTTNGVIVATQVAVAPFVRIPTSTFFAFSGISTIVLPTEFSASGLLTGTACVRGKDWKCVNQDGEHWGRGEICERARASGNHSERRR